MDTIKSFKGYDKVDKLKQQAFKKGTRKHITIITISSLILIAVIVAAVAGILIHKQNTSSNPSPNSLPNTDLNPATSLKSVCDATQYPHSCIAAISSLPEPDTTDPEKLFKLFLKIAMDELSNLTRLKLNASGDTNLEKAIAVCSSVLDDSLGRLNDSMSVVIADEKILSPTKVHDVEAWFTAALTDHDACLDVVGEFLVLGLVVVRGIRRTVG